MDPSVILEVGTTHTRGMVINPCDNCTYEILAMAETKNTGVKKSEIVNLDNTNTSVKKIINLLTERAETEIHSVNLIYSGGNPQAEIISGMQPINSRNQIVEEHHIESALNNAIEKELPDDRSLIEDIKIDHILNGVQKVDNPIGMSAKSLNVNIMRIHVDKDRLTSILNMLSDNSLDYENVYIAGLCAAIGATTPEQRDEGVLVIDLGGGCTNWAVYVNKVVRCIDGIPIGGDHITNDIRCAFKTTNENAENLKKKQGSATIITSKQKLQYQQDFTDKYILLSDLSRVINARIDETIRIIHSKLVENGLIEAINSVVLCGNGAYLKNITTLVSNIFQIPCSIANQKIPYKDLNENYPTLGFIPLLGAAQCCTRDAIIAQAQNRSKGFFRKLFS